MSLQQYKDDLEWDTILTLVEQGNIDDQQHADDIKDDYKTLDSMAASMESCPAGKLLDKELMLRPRAGLRTHHDVNIPGKLMTMADHFETAFKKRDIATCWKLLYRMQDFITNYGEWRGYC